MPVAIKVPAMGESITEGVIAKWLCAVGQEVAADEPVVEVETDKITVEVPAPRSGVLTAQGADEGDTVAVGQVIGEIDESAAAAVATATPAPAPSAPAQAAGSNGSSRTTVTGGNGATPAAAAISAGGPVTAMPAAQAEAARLGVELGSVPGTGRGGRILKEDVARAAAAAVPTPAPTPQPEPPPPSATPSVAVVPASTAAAGTSERKAMSPLRRRVAERLVLAQQSAAILTTFNEVDMSEVITLRKKYKEPFVERHGVKLGFMSFFVKAAVQALKEVPTVNAEVDGTDVIYHYRYDIGVAVGGGKGLVVPVIRSADQKSFAQIEREIGDYATRAQANKLTLDELQGGTFTISNGGVYGSMLSTPILNPPQTGILGLHNIVQRPVAVNGQVEVRPVMYVALSYDHRLIDGREAVTFLVRIKQNIESPERTLLEI